MEVSIIISCIVFAVWYTMLKGEIFGKLGAWLDKHVPEKLKGPIFDCPVCMVPWYGSIIYWLVWDSDVETWLVRILTSMGLNVIIVRLWPDR
jgi:hypothetical protein